MSETEDLFGNIGVQGYALSRLSVDWIEIGFSISGTESYLEFLKSINMQSRLTLPNYGPDSISFLLWSLVVDNGFEDEVIADWLTYYQPGRKKVAKYAPISIPFDSCPMELGEIVSLMMESTFRGRFPFLPKYPAIHTSGVYGISRIIESAEISFSVLDQDRALSENVASLWTEMSKNKMLLI
mgnify:FL=1